MLLRARVYSFDEFNTFILLCQSPFHQADDPKGSDEEQLLKLFEVTRSVMLVKATQAVVALEELEKMAANQGKENVYNGE